MYGQEERERYFTIEEANQMLPLVRAIVQDIVEMAPGLLERRDRLLRIRATKQELGSNPHDEEHIEMENAFAKDTARLEELLGELKDLGIDFKGWDGLIDFPGRLDEREICLCWKLGEPEVAHWHEIDAGFAGRRPIMELALA